MSTPCETCARIAARDAGTAPRWDAIHRTPHWDVAHSYDTALPGWMVLVARRHLTAIDELTEAEAAELGVLLVRVSVALRVITGCQKTYVAQFAEAAAHPHVHVHVIPRMPDLPRELRGPRIFSLLGVGEGERVNAAAMDTIAVQMRQLLGGASP
jgi:diadenosine tetraphosphate (Ap4A) HIT family hydrolase